jgi:hypothetical protein
MPWLLRVLTRYRLQGTDKRCATRIEEHTQREGAVMKVLMIAVILLTLSGCNMMPRWGGGGSGGGYQGNNTTADPSGTGNG